MIARLVLIHGRVQGVGYRYALEITADRIGVSGWVRNRFNGTVEAHFEGAAELVSELIEWTHAGPPGASVTRVDVQEVELEGFVDFERRPTA